MKAHLKMANKQEEVITDKLVKWLINKRLIMGFTQEQLAEKIERPQSYVSKYENGEKLITFVELLILCKALNSDPEDFIIVLKQSDLL